jgi:D-alanyl-D-alanine endopeptidase (penicillin-binding protein 7)
MNHLLVGLLLLLSALPLAAREMQLAYNTPPSAATPLRSPPTLSASSALVLDQTSGVPVFSKNADARRPIASITKLMTAMVVLDAGQSLDQRITISEAERDRLRSTSSRLPIGTTLTRRELLRLALMSSENRAAAALCRSYPGGTANCVGAMNRKARALGMQQTRFYDGTGLHGGNVSTARDLARMVQASQRYALIHAFTTTEAHLQDVGRYNLGYRNTNGLVKDPRWNIGVSKTGYIREAGRCLVMQARINQRPMAIVLLNAQGKYSAVGDASRLRNWLEGKPVSEPAAKSTRKSAGKSKRSRAAHKGSGTKRTG